MEQKQKKKKGGKRRMGVWGDGGDGLKESGNSGDTVSSAYTQLDMVKLAQKIAWECRQL